MILTCPNCATRFFADDQLIGPVGRRVKCTVCENVWSGAPAKLVEEAASRKAWSEPPSAGPLIVADAEATTSALFVDRGAVNRGAKRQDDGKPWTLGLVFAVFAVVAGLLVFRSAIEKAFPGAVTVYRSLGLTSAVVSRA